MSENDSTQVNDNMEAEDATQQSVSASEPAAVAAADVTKSSSNGDADGIGAPDDTTNDAQNAPAESVKSVGEKTTENNADESAKGGNDESADGEKKPAEDVQSTTDGEAAEDSSDKKRPAEDDEPLPTLPLKRARTAYFIFADDKRQEVKQTTEGGGVAAMAKAIGQLWSTLQPKDKEVYELQAAKERERVARDTQRLKDAGLLPEPNNNEGERGVGGDEDPVIFPIGRIRKICKLDPEVKGMSKESTLMITKAAELFCTKLGKECVTMAQMQNRRKLLPEDVVEVCSIKERFMFLKSDIVDLRKAQIDEMNAKEKENGKEAGGKGGKTGKGGEVSGATNTLDSYFGKVRN